MMRLEVESHSTWYQALQQSVSDCHEAKRYGSPKCFLICRRTFLSWELQSSFERESERRVEMTRERKRVFMLALEDLFFLLYVF
ncbi:hypothetical protein NC653_036107 [Populus alba x Populus x berolinensis]|uniref:Uncharacterized protein n=1 Tax=Populus alba x Populus x berolinensis TaxID=444605 RepID=A0AAD6PUH7_9ROSI|nr:hypothetical protein NC653_036107 [Populus alba x Populus x berolinensis]